MSEASSERNPVEQLAEEFAARFRTGERPSLSEYTNRYPQYADEIRELFPALVAIEQLKPRLGNLTGDFDGLSVEDEPPQELGDYHLLREVGRGGMGVVYEAEQISLGRRVALKVLPPQAKLNPTYLERFRREAKAAAKLHHTNIVPVYGVGEDDGVCYYAMQFIAGDGIDKILADLRRMRELPTIDSSRSRAVSILINGFEPLSSATILDEKSPTGKPSLAHSPTSSLSATGPESEYFRGVARVGLQAAEGLAYAHKQGVLHRDIKPSNLLLDSQGIVWITDFGLAKAEGSDELTTTGDIVGTMRFMAPERFDGRSLPQSDLYALGLTLYELLTLRPAFDDANKAQLMDRVLHDTPLSPRRIDPRIPRDLETVVLKCIAKEPRDRYDSAEDLGEDLRRFLTDRPIKARRASLAERVWRSCRRNPAMASLSASVLLLLLVMAFGGAILSASRGRALSEARHKLLASYVSEARARRFSGRAGQRFGTLGAVRKATELAHEMGMPAATFSELRELAVAALSLPDLRLVWEVEGWPRDCERYDFDDRLEHVVRSDAKGNVTVVRMSDYRELARLPGRGELRTVGWSRSGSSVRILDHVNGALILWNYETGELTRLGSLPADSRGTLLRRSMDDRQQTWVYPSGKIELTDSSGQSIRQVRLGHWLSPRPNARDGNPNASHPYRNLHAVSFRRQPGAIVYIVDLDQGKVVAELPRTGEEEIGEMAWLPDGRTLVVGSTSSVVQWDLPTRRVIHALDHRGGGLSAEANALGDIVTVSEWAGGAKLWHGQTGELLLNLPGINCHFRSRGHWFLGSNVNGTPKQVYQLHSARECRTLVRARFRGDVGGYWRCTIHPNGRLAATGTTKGVTLLDLDTGLDIGHLDLGHNWNVTFDPATGDLITYGEKGLFRWPVQVSGDERRHVRLGPPLRLPVAGRGLSAVVRVSADGKTLAVAQGAHADHAVVLHKDEPNHPVLLRPVEDVRSHLAISPNGRWVATGRNDGHGGDIRVWDTRTGTLVKAFGIPDGMCVAFSPDGRWLVANDKKQYRFYHVGTWDEGPQGPVKTPMFIDWPPGISPDGKLMALERGDGAVRLIDVATGRDLAVLEDPQQGRAGEMTFSPDGTRLLLVNKDQKVLRLWDLRQLRAELKLLDLDWDAAEYPMGSWANSTDRWLPPLEVEILGTDQVKEPGAK